MQSVPCLTRQRAEEHVQRFAGVTVSVLGDLMLDRYFWGEVDRISPEAPVPVVRVTRRSGRLGGAANVAANLRALGVAVDLHGTLGDDRAAAELRELLDENRIEHEGVMTLDGRETTEKVRIVARNQQVVRADFEAEQPIGSEARQQLCARLSESAQRNAALVVSDYGKGVIHQDYLRELIAVWRRAGKPVLIDPHVGHTDWYRGATIMTPNTKEASRMVPAPPAGSEPELARMAAAIRSRLELDALLITRGEDGMSLFHGVGEEVHIPTVGKEVYDVTGAGDTVIGVLAAALGSGAGLLDAVTLANGAAGEVIKEVGTSAVTAERLLSVFD